MRFYMQILVSPYFWLVPPHFVCTGEGTGYVATKMSVDTAKYYCQCAHVSISSYTVTLSRGS